MVLVWYWYGIGIGIGMVFVRYWYATGLILVCKMYGGGIVFGRHAIIFGIVMCWYVIGWYGYGVGFV